MLGSPHSLPGRRRPNARSVKRSARGSQKPSVVARRYPFDRLRSGPGARIWHEHSPLPLRVTRWASYAESSTTPCRTGPFPGIPRQVSGYRRPRGMNPSRSRTLNCGSSQIKSIPGETGSQSSLRGTADFVGASWQPEMYRYRSRSASAESISRVLGRGASRRNVSGERSPGTHRSDPGTVVAELTNLQAQSSPSELVCPPRTSRRCGTAIFAATASMRLRCAGPDGHSSQPP